MATRNIKENETFEISTDAGQQATINTDTFTGKGTLYITGSGHVTLTGGNDVAVTRIDPTATVNIDTGAEDKVWETYIDGSGKICKMGSSKLTLDMSPSAKLTKKLKNQKDKSPFIYSADMNIAEGAVAIDTRAADWVYEGDISGDGSFEKEGSGTLELKGNNSHTGQTNLLGGRMTAAPDAVQALSPLSDVVLPDSSEGVLEINGVNNIPSITGNGEVAIKAGSCLSIGDSSSHIFKGTISGEGDLIKRDTGTCTLAGPITLTGTTTTAEGKLIIHTLPGTTTTLTGPIDGSGHFEKQGDGTLDLQGINTRSGPFVITGGTVALNSSNNLSTAPISILSDTTLEAKDGLSIVAPIELGDAVLTINTGSHGVIATEGLSGAGHIVKQGLGNLNLQGSSSYTGKTIINEGAIVCGVQNTLSPYSAHSIQTTGTLDTAGFHQEVGSVSGDGTINLMGGQFTTGNDNESTVFGGEFSGSSGSSTFHKTGLGMLSINSDSLAPILTLRVDQGIVKLGQDNMFTAPGTTLFVNKTALLDCSDHDQCIQGNITGEGCINHGTGQFSWNLSPETDFCGSIKGTGPVTITSASGITRISGAKPGKKQA